MADNSNRLSDDELWAKCQQSGSITPQDLGINSPQNSSDGTTYLTEGTDYLQFELKTRIKNNFVPKSYPAPSKKSLQSP